MGKKSKKDWRPEDRGTDYSPTATTIVIPTLPEWWGVDSWAMGRLCAEEMQFMMALLYPDVQAIIMDYGSSVGPQAEEIDTWIGENAHIAVQRAKAAHPGEA
jgi:hypothetical protein